MRLMFGLSSMNRGAFCSLPCNSFRMAQRSGVMSSARRMAASGMLDSAEMIRCANSFLLISKLKMMVVNP